MKTSFDKFMASSAVQEVSNVELSEVKVELAMDVNTIMKEADSLIFENAKLEGKAISLLNSSIFNISIFVNSIGGSKSVENVLILLLLK